MTGPQNYRTRTATSAGNTDQQIRQNGDDLRQDRLYGCLECTDTRHVFINKDGSKLTSFQLLAILRLALGIPLQEDLVRRKAAGNRKQEQSQKTADQSGSENHTGRPDSDIAS
ncbi:hypothetical protein NDU88_000567 [Pleurodeles waltl]|uniref:Uncharacterized protein n=1 Tax=Pleurodeles waltl TaxID=8319 RepID=A0AAV7URE7_PLEWA|nr:hypothetical protein NDU88_000567 [Pleurodeles waltl]